jgi:hypothetical protein
MTIVETLRSRFRPEWKTRVGLAGLDTMFEKALIMIAAPQAEKAALEKAERGIATRLRKSRRAGTPAHPPTGQGKQGGRHCWQSWRMPETLSATHADAEETRCRSTPPR